MTKLRLIELLWIGLVLLPAAMALNFDDEKWVKRFNYIAFVIASSWLTWLTHLIFHLHGE